MRTICTVECVRYFRGLVFFKIKTKLNFIFSLLNCSCMRHTFFWCISYDNQMLLEKKNETKNK